MLCKLLVHDFDGLGLPWAVLSVRSGQGTLPQTGKDRARARRYKQTAAKTLSLSPSTLWLVSILLIPKVLSFSY